MIEGESGKPSLGDLLEELKIAPLPQGASRSEVAFLNGTPPLSFIYALSLTPEVLLEQSLRRLRAKEIVSVGEKRHGGGRKPQREITQTREGFRKDRKRLLSKGPGKVLATLVANSGKIARWTHTGLEGADGEEQRWVVPDEDEIQWWGFVYGEARRGDVSDLIGGDKAWLFHAFFAIQAKRLPLSKKDRYIGAIDEYVPDPEDGRVTKRLRQITQLFR